MVKREEGFVFIYYIFFPNLPTLHINRVKDKNFWEYSVKARQSSHALLNS